jgi:hypothetical protein
MRGDEFGNLGDLFAPIIIAAYTGKSIRHASHRSLRRRLISVGTIGQLQRYGLVDIWGSGFQGLEQDPFKIQTKFSHPPLTRFRPHLIRGPFSAALLRGAGYAVPDVYGDPALLLPHIWPDHGIRKRWDLGVVVHVSETANLHPTSLPRTVFTRYAVPEDMSDTVTVFNTVVDYGVDDVRTRIEDILSCRRILTTSLHALAVAEAYGIPCATFDFHGGESGYCRADDDSQSIDHRMRDFYAGSGRQDILVYRTERHLPTDWAAAMAFLDRHWQPLKYDSSKMLEAFPRRLGQVTQVPDPDVVARLPDLMKLGKYR